MLRFTLLTCLIAVIATSQVFAQQPMEDVVYLKNGGIVHGTIVEQIPGESLKIQTRDGNVLVFAMDEIDRLSKDFAVGTSSSASIKAEIGTQFGHSYLSADGEGLTLTGVPTIPPLSSLYVSWFPSEQLAIGPEFGFGRLSFDDSGDEYSLSLLYLGGRGAFFLPSNAVSGLYLLGNGALLGLYGDVEEREIEDIRTSSGSEHIFSAGVGLGYQWRVGPAFVLKAEGRYQRWWVNYDEEYYDGWDYSWRENTIGVNQFSFFLGLGTRLDGR